MPLGEIKERELSTREKEWRKRWASFEGKLYLDIEPTIRHMSRAEYFAWTYALDPRTALILSTEPVFRDILAYQRDKRWYHEVRDYFWRVRNAR